MLLKIFLKSIFVTVCGKLKTLPFPQRDGDSIREEIMENSDIGEHEDVDVKSERQKVFNFVVSPALGQEPPLVLLQVKQYKLNHSL